MYHRLGNISFVNNSVVNFSECIDSDVFDLCLGHVAIDDINTYIMITLTYCNSDS